MADDPPTSHASAFALVGPVALVILTTIVFFRVCTAEFVQWDDPLTIAHNPVFNPPSWSGIVGYWTRPAEHLYIPLTYTFWGALAFVGRLSQPDASGTILNPWVFHSANLVLHLIAVLTVWAILRRLCPSPLAAWLGAAVFAVHPVQLEAIAWASGTKDLLCGLFTCLAIVMLIRHRAEPGAGKIVLLTLCVLAACLAKPTGIVAPFIAMAIDVLLVGITLRRSLATLWPCFVIAGVLGIIGKIAQPPIGAFVAPLWARPLIAGDAIAFYLWKLVWPVNLAIDYGRSPQPLLDNSAMYYAWLVPLILAIVLIVPWPRQRKVQRQLTAASLILLIGIVPVLGFVPFTFQAYSTVADHYLYPSMLGVALAAAAMASTVRPALAAALGAFVIGALGVLAFRASAHWRNNDALFAHTLEVNPASYLAHTNWAVALAQRGERTEAMSHLRSAIDLNTDYAFAHLNLAGLLLESGERAGAASEYREVLRIYSTQRNTDRALAQRLQRMIEELEAASP